MSLPMNSGARGLTLMELVVASVLAVVVVLGIGSIDVARVRMQEEIRQTSDAASPGRMEAALTMITIRRGFENADRINLIGPSNLQIRVPLGTTFDAAGDYRWDQYKLVGNELRLYSGGCGSPKVLASQITNLSVAYQDVAAAPPGGEPPNQDNNVLSYSLAWSDGVRTQVFPGWVTIRSGAYTNIATGLDGSGGDVSPPPGGC